MDWLKTNRLVAAGIWVFSFIIYTMTVASTVSYWDCGEFIACSYGLAVPHPPGAPLFLLVGRFFSMIPFVEDIGFRVNYISVLSSTFTIMLLYLSIVHLVREWKGKLEGTSDWQIAIFSGVIGSLTFAFTHSFWFNAVEAEVYAPSMLFTALIVWLILVWSSKSDQPGNERYLLMIAYCIGLAIGIHLLNVLALPFVTLIYYYKRYDFNIKTFMINAFITVGIILFVYPGIVKYLPRVAEIGGAVGLAAIFIFLFAVVFWSINNNKKMISLVFLSVLFIMIGYSTYTTIYIRSNLDPMIDENNPETIERFISYLNREPIGLKFGRNRQTESAIIVPVNSSGNIRLTKCISATSCGNLSGWMKMSAIGPRIISMPYHFYWDYWAFTGILRMTKNTLWRSWPCFS
jgi:hypothetical protein